MSQRKAVQCASARRYRAAQQAAGLCWSCPTGVPATNPNTGQPFRRCLACRRKNSAWYHGRKEKAA